MHSASLTMVRYCILGCGEGGRGRMLFFLGNKVKKTMSKCHIPERSHVTKPLLLSNNVIISPTEHGK